MSICFRRATPAMPIRPWRHGWRKPSKRTEPLRVKLGIDPTGSNIRGLQHPVPQARLPGRWHTAVLIIGDFTARIGDPTGKSATRVQLTKEQVDANASTYLRQPGQDQLKETALLDFETPRLEVRYNSEWAGGDGPACGDRIARHWHRRSDAGQGRLLQALRQRHPDRPA